jgi:N-acetylmuramoyl-L-alanine amidase
MGRRVKQLLVVLLVVLVFGLANAFTLRHGDHKDFYRLVFQPKKKVWWMSKEFTEDNILFLAFSDNPEMNIDKLQKELSRSLGKYAKEIKITNDGKVTRVYITLKKGIKGKVFELKEPFRIVIDLKPASKIEKKTTTPAKTESKVVKKKEKPKIKRTRVVKKSTGSEDIIASLIKKSEKKTSKKEIKKAKAKSHKVKTKTAKKKVKKRKIVKRKSYNNLRYVKKKRFRRKIVIVLDPGHGGRDPGATANGLKEKDINLRIARRVKFYLERDGRFKVYLTRNRDTFVPLSKRSLMAIEKNADLFISIHCNSLKRNRRWTGTYIYTLNLRGARSKLARIVENRENKRVIRFIRVSSNNYVNRIVADLAISSTMVEGRRFARYLRGKLRYVTRVRRIESANFVVLKTPGIPSVLIETLFITSPRDARKLKNWHFRDRFSRAIYEAIVDYFY